MLFIVFKPLVSNFVSWGLEGQTFPLYLSIFNCWIRSKSKFKIKISFFSTVKGKWKNVVETPKPVLRLYPLHGMLPLNVRGGRGGKELAIEHTTPGERHQDSRTVFPAFCFYTILQYAIPPTSKLVSLCITLVNL